MLYGPREWLLIMAIAVVLDTLTEWLVLRSVFGVSPKRRPFCCLLLAHSLSEAVLFIGVMVALCTMGMK